MYTHLPGINNNGCPRTELCPIVNVVVTTDMSITQGLRHAYVIMNYTPINVRLS